MLVHICCSVDSHFFLQKLKEKFPNEKLIGFFYDPNIHPYSEYQLRLLDVKRSCKILNIPLIEGDYDVENWLNAVRGYENEPEKGKRCEICFDKRLEITAKKAKELNEKTITTTLLTSPKKSKEQLEKAGEDIERKFGVKFITLDFRKGGGTQEQFKMAKEDKLYRQNYCGCMYGLKKQRDEQEREACELFSPISNQILPSSIEDKIKLYQKRMRLEEKGIPYKIKRDKFLNYRLKRALVKIEKEVTPSYFLSYSFLKRKYTKGKIEDLINNIYYFNREEIKIIDLSFFNNIANTSFKNVKELIFKPISFEKELEIRFKIENSPCSLSPIIVLEKRELFGKKIEIICDSLFYQDVRENLVIL